MASNALKKITAEAKRIRKKQPGKSWKNAVREAGKKYRSGTIGKVKKKKAPAKPRKKKAKRAAPKKRRRAPRKKSTVTATRRTTTTRVRASKIGSAVRRHRMADSGNGLKKLLPVVLLVGAGLLLWKAFAPKAPVVPPGAPPLLTTSNTVRNQQSSQIVAYAAAAGLALDAITRLIQSLNNRPDTDVQNIYDELDRGGDLPATLYA
jgi:hypothetical protein